MWMTGAQQILRMTTDGTITTFPIPNMNPTQIIAGYDGNLWFAQGTLLVQITPEGALTRFYRGDVILSIASSGTIWYATDRSFGSLAWATTRPAFRPLGDIVPTKDGLWGTTAGGLGFVTYADASFTPTFAPAPVTLFPTATDPKYVAAGPDGSIWYTSSLPPGPAASVTVGRIGPSGAHNEVSVDGTATSRPAIAPDGSAWILFDSVSGGSRLARFTAAGDMTVCVISSSGGVIALGPDQRIWFTEPSLNRMAIFTP
jgi:virginiamycin B lyase